MNPFKDFLDNLQDWLKTKGELVDDVSFLRSQVAEYVARCKELEDRVVAQALILEALGAEAMEK